MVDSNTFYNDRQNQTQESVATQNDTPVVKSSILSTFSDINLPENFLFQKKIENIFFKKRSFEVSLYLKTY